MMCGAEPIDVGSASGTFRKRRSASAISGCRQNRTCPKCILTAES